MSLRKIYRALRRNWRRRDDTGRAHPVIPIENSVTPNVLVCLETGTRHVALRRHLAETLGLSPAEYRQRWGLPDDYPMVSTAYVTLRNKTIFRARTKAE
ncbi:MucR family transcriptional regulator [Seohaeicola nanhaiensis]|uniref:MucR family transcriptional regulator n=1 Tax=Seohaeicola nanhaiensis TaxID=1387282 RepID=A0ABV9KHW9_9RHOB